MRFPADVAEARRALEINPDFIWGLHVLSGAYREKGMYEESLPVQERILAMNPSVGRCGFTRAALGDTAATREVIVELAENPGQKDLVYLGLLKVRVGNVDEALRWLEADYEARVDWFSWVATAADGGSGTLRRSRTSHAFGNSSRGSICPPADAR